MQPYTVKKINNIPFHYIIGIERSGTTLLSHILNAHPQVLATQEARFMLHYWQYFKDLPTISNEDLDLFFKHLWQIKEIDATDLRIWGIDKSELYQQLRTLLPNTHFLSLCKMVYLHYFMAATKTDIQFIIDKNPLYTLFVENWIAQDPNAKFVALIRDYRANIASRLKHQIDPIVKVGFTAAKWKYYNERILQLQKKYPQKIKLVYFEDLITNTEKVVKNICTFWGIVFKEEMLQYYKNNQTHYQQTQAALSEQEAAQFRAMHGNLQSPPSKKVLGKWQQQLSNFEVYLADWICGDTAKRMGYMPTNKLHLAQKIKWLPYKYWYAFLFTCYINWVQVYFYLPLKWRLWKKRKENRMSS